MTSVTRSRNQDRRHAVEGRLKAAGLQIAHVGMSGEVQALRERCLRQPAAGAQVAKFLTQAPAHRLPHGESRDSTNMRAI